MGNIRKRLQNFLTMMFLLLAYLLPVSALQALEPQQKLLVNKIVESFKQNNRVAISRMVSYPLLRQTPLKSINNPSEFLNRFNEVFDKALLNTITSSNLHTDWDSIGWQGVILNNGIIALDPEGNITEINYQSAREQALIHGLNSRRLAKGRRSLHRSVTHYDQAVVELTTARFHIRVDSIGKGQGKLRYSAWPINKNTSEEPDIILNNGRVFNSNGRNQSYIFNNGTYSYQLNIRSLSSNAIPTGSLEVFKNGKSWIREVATQVIRR